MKGFAPKSQRWDYQLTVVRSALPAVAVDFSKQYLSVGTLEKLQLLLPIIIIDTQFVSVD